MWKIKLFPIDWKHTKMVVWCPNMWHNLQYGISKLVWFFPHHLGRASVIKRGLLVFPLETHWPFYYGFYLTMSLANLFIVSMHQALNFGFLKCFLFWIFMSNGTVESKCMSMWRVIDRFFIIIFEGWVRSKMRAMKVWYVDFPPCFKMSIVHYSHHLCPTSRFTS